LSKPIDRKVAIINHKLHEGRDSVNAYVVFKEKESVDKALEGNGAELLGKHIRIDRADKPKVFMSAFVYDHLNAQLFKQGA
jgi:nucleolar protein 12